MGQILSGANMANAQSSVAVYSSVDAGFMKKTDAILAIGKRDNNKLGFNYVEDLGGGLKALPNWDSAMSATPARWRATRVRCSRAGAESPCKGHLVWREPYLCREIGIDTQSGGTDLGKITENICPDTAPVSGNGIYAILRASFAFSPIPWRTMYSISSV